MNVWSAILVARAPRGALAGSDVAALDGAGGPIEGTAAFQPFLGGVFSVREGSDPMEIAAAVTSPNLFDLLGARPLPMRSSVLVRG